MAAQKAQSKLMAKYGAKLDKSVKEHRDDEVDYGFQRIPGGIANGIAKLRKAYFEQYKEGTYKGEYYFRAEGVIEEPSHNNKGIPVAGLVTSIMIPVCDTKTAAGKETTQEEHVAEILNEMKKLGGEDFMKGASGSEMESLAESLTIAKPFFKFATSESKPQIDPATKKAKVDPKTGEPYSLRIWENWYGAKGLESYSPPDHAKEAVEDRSGSSGEATEPENPAGIPDEPTNAVETPVEDVDTSDVEVLVGLAETADLQDESDECEQAQSELEKIAIELGISKKKVKGADNWAEVVEMIQGAKAENEAAAPIEEEGAAVDDKYDVGKPFKYAPMLKTKDSKGKIVTKKSTKSIDVEIMESDTEKETCTIKSLVDDKTLWKGVKFSDLIED